MDDKQQPQEPRNTSDQKEPAYMAFAEENEPDTTPVDTPATYETPSEAPAPMVVKKKSHTKGWLVWGLVVLALASLASFAFWTWSEAENRKQEVNALQSELETVKAGYKDAKDETATEEIAKPTDKELVIETTNAYWHAAKGAEKDKLTTVVDKLELPFARVSVSSNTGVSCILKKSDDIWLVLFCAQGDSPETEAMIKKYGVPDSIIKS